MSKYINRPEPTEGRKIRLEKEWEDNLPCQSCVIKDICKHAGTFHRPNFDNSIFNVTVSCSIYNKYNEPSGILSNGGRSV